MTQDIQLAEERLGGSSSFLFHETGEGRDRGFLLLIAFVAWLLCAGASYGQVMVTARKTSAGGHVKPLPAAPLGASISGTVTDTQDDIIPGATVTLQGPNGKSSAETGKEGGFAFNDLKPGGPYRLSVTCTSCIPWTSSAITLQPGQFMVRDDIHLRLSGGTISVVVRPKTELQIATEQVHAEEHQRVLGVIPNFYVSYDPKAAPLSTGLKYKLAARTALDPVSIAGAMFMAGIDQAAGIPNYGGGMQGYSKRLGSEYTTGFVDIMTGGAVLPALLHQDPRYFYKGTGTKRARLMHAIGSAFLCRGDDGKTQINFSSMGGDLTAGALSNLYIPEEDRGVGATMKGFGITTAGHITVDIMQEFFLNKLTHRGHKKSH